jgi:hypothetical protein
MISFAAQRLMELGSPSCARLPGQMAEKALTAVVQEATCTGCRPARSMSRHPKDDAEAAKTQ